MIVASEWLATERTGMCMGQDVIGCWVDQRCKGFGMIAPEHIYDVGLSGGDVLNCRMCEGRPVEHMRSRFAFLNCESGVEHEDPLTCPVSDVAIGWSLLELLLKLFEYVFERGWKWR